MMNTFSQVGAVERTSIEIPAFFVPAYAHREDRPRFLLAPDVGIGDAVAIGLSAVDQIVRNEAGAWGAIDILCNRVQAQLFAHDPRINRVIVSDCRFFPGQQISQWLRGIVLNESARRLVTFLHKRHYEAIHPGIVAPGLYFRLHARLMYPDMLKLARDLFFPRLYVSMRKVARQMVNRYFGQSAPVDEFVDEVLLYVSREQVQKARAMAARLKTRATESACKLLLVAPDSASAVTRPPTRLLAAALSHALAHCPHLLVAILPAYTDRQCAGRLWRALACDDGHAGRVILLPAEPRMPLLELAALLDQADIILTGDTGVMHLAAATKRVAGEDGDCPTRHTSRIIALFGGTNPSFYGYRTGATILGEGRPEQHSFRPGFSKEGYDARGKDLFDHIDPQAVTEALINHLSL